MGSPLDDFRPRGWSVEEEIRIYLRACKKKDVSTEACQAFARQLVQKVIKNWEPGDPLTFRQAQLVGRAFDKLLETKRDAGWKVARLEQPPYKHRDEMTEQDMRTYKRRCQP